METEEYRMTEDEFRRQWNKQMEKKGFVMVRCYPEKCFTTFYPDEYEIYKDNVYFTIKGRTIGYTRLSNVYVIL